MSEVKHPIERAVALARRDPFFVGYALERFGQFNGIDDRQLQSILNCEHDAFKRLALCRRPASEEHRFVEYAARIAAYARCDEEALLRLLREIEASEALQQPTAGTADITTLLAARDGPPTQSVQENDEAVEESSEDDS